MPHENIGAAGVHTTGNANVSELTPQTDADNGTECDCEDGMVVHPSI